MKKNRKRRNVYMLLLVMMIAGIGIGYAYLSTTVNFNGNAVINSADWNIHLENLKVTLGSVTPTTEAVINEDMISVSYGVTLTNPGDYFEFTVDAKNDGSIDGMIERISSKLNDEEITTLPSYLDYEVSYSSGAEPKQYHYLKSSKKETFKVKIRYKKNIIADDLPKESQTLNLNFSVSYKQADNNGQEINHQIIRYTVNIGNSRNMNSFVTPTLPIHNDIVQYKTVAEARADFYNNPFYLKHILDGGIVKERYLEFIISNEMASNNSGMKAGTYSLKEPGDESYESNKSTLKLAFGESNCTEESNVFQCSTNGLTVETSQIINRAQNSNYGCLVRTGSNGAACIIKTS